MSRHEPCDVYVGRGSIWGNPFRIGVDGEREDVIRKYEEYLRGRKDLIKLLPTLRGKRIGCWCSPLKCHADLLAKWADEGVPK